MTLAPLAAAPLVGLLFAVAIQGCSGGDPGEVHFVNRTAGGSGFGNGGGGGGGGGTGDDGGGGTVGGDGGTVGGDSGVVTTNAFTGAPAFVQQAGPATNNASHNFAGGSKNPAGQVCPDCHDGTTATKFSAGGTVYKDLAGTTPAASIEVVFRDTAGKVTVTHTDTLGNFYLPGATAVTAGMLVGVRDGTANGNSPMADVLAAGKAGGGCNAAGTCHGGTQGKIHDP